MDRKTGELVCSIPALYYDGLHRHFEKNGALSCMVKFRNNFVTVLAHFMLPRRHFNKNVLQEKKLAPFFFIELVVNVGFKSLDIILQGVFNLAEVKLLACAALEDVEYVETRGLEVAGGVIRLADKHVVAGTVV